MAIVVWHVVVFYLFTIILKFLAFLRAGVEFDPAL